MCGIFGIVTSEEKNLGPILTAAGHRLAYRGYDSVGIATIHGDHKIDLRKDAGNVNDVANKHHFEQMTGSRGILQLRWATFGEPSQINAQPHLDSGGKMVGAHNGNVVNNVNLRKEFQTEGMLVRSTNDGESCVHAVERYIRQGKTMLDSIRLAYNDLQGDYAFVIALADDDKLYAFKKGSGLVTGIGDNFTCISSDLPSVLPLTRNILFMNDSEIVELTATQVKLFRVDNGARIYRQPELVTETMEAAQKGGYPHFMLKEIHEQPAVARELLHLLENSQDLPIIREQLRSARNIYFIGCGTSYNACLSGAVFFNRIANRAVIPVAAPQFTAQYQNTLSDQDVGIFVSQSGETKDVLNAVEVAQKRGMKVYSLVNVVGSTLTKKSLHWLPLTCGYEISVPATKTFTNQLVAFLYLAYRVADKDPHEVFNMPDLMADVLANAAEMVDQIIPYFQDWNDFYCLGYGLTYPIALEGALKIKEITYAHCEGMLSTEFKHGPLAAVSRNYPVIFVSSQADIPLIISGLNETTCRRGLAVVIGPENSSLRENASHLLPLPDANDDILSILEVIPLQLLSYAISLKKGFDPDFPRNLSKTLTVD